MKKNRKKEVRKADVKNIVRKPQVKKVGGKKEKDPKRVEAAKRAWETIRAKAKENM